ncbi:hypothetical protein N41_0283 [Lactococcus cremoris]|nr:hypothetical protein N41_0283 [Lactococcus cremoris]
MLTRKLSYFDNSVSRKRGWTSCPSLFYFKINLLINLSVKS